MTTDPARQPKGIPVGGRFANKTNSKSPVELEASAGAASPSAPGPDIEAMSKARDKLKQTCEWHQVRSRPEYAELDLQHQRASVELAAAAVRAEYPEAKTLVLRENEDGEAQYELAGILNADGELIISAATDNAWAEEIVGDENGPTMSELAWTVSTTDNSWAQGVAQVGDSQQDGKTVTIDIDSALAMGSLDEVMRKANEPDPREVRLAEMSVARSQRFQLFQLSKERDMLREARDEAADSNNPEHVILDRQVQRASVQIAATSIRNRYPDAHTLVLRENEDGENQYDVLAVHDSLGYPVPGTGSDSDWTRDEVAGENSADLQELSWSLNPEDDTWADGIAEITTTREYGKTAKVNIHAAAAADPRAASTFEQS